MNDTAMTWHTEYLYANGVRLIFTSDDENPHGIRFEGTDGWIFVNRRAVQAEPISLLTVSRKGSDERLYNSTSHHRDFLDCVRSRRDPVCPVEIGHRTNVICNMSDIATRLGRKLQWNPQTERFVNDGEANRMLSCAMRSPWRL
jgi:myo-inositol 2-dehydrogenase / D-chiro-inositol 1-dehydrogenase